MKKITTLSLALLLAGIANAQVNVGAIAGINISNIIKTGDSNYTTDFKTGLHGGKYSNVECVPES